LNQSSLHPPKAGKAIKLRMVRVIQEKSKHKGKERGNTEIKKSTEVKIHMY
jgi:hypothetical protein